MLATPARPHRHIEGGAVGPMRGNHGESPVRPGFKRDRNWVRPADCRMKIEMRFLAVMNMNRLRVGSLTGLWNRYRQHCLRNTTVARQVTGLQLIVSGGNGNSEVAVRIGLPLTCDDPAVSCGVIETAPARNYTDMRDGFTTRLRYRAGQNSLRVDSQLDRERNLIELDELIRSLRGVWTHREPRLSHLKIASRLGHRFKMK